MGGKRVNVLCEETRNSGNRKNGFKGREELESLLDDDFDGSLTLTDLGNLLGKTRQGVRVNLISIGRHNFFLQRRKQYEEGKKEEKRKSQRDRIGICSLLQKMAIDKADDWAVVQTINYRILRGKRSEVSLYKVEHFLRLYKRYKDEGRPVGLQRMAEESGLGYAMCCLQILRIIGEKSLYWSATRRVFKRHKEQMKRAASLPLCNEDIAYFIGIGKDNVRSFYSRNNIPRNNGFKPMCTFGCKKQEIGLYWMASMVYEAVDREGFSRAELHELFDGGAVPKVVNYCLKHRKKIEPKIDRFLTTIYPEMVVTKRS